MANMTSWDMFTGKPRDIPAPKDEDADPREGTPCEATCIMEGECRNEPPPSLRFGTTQECQYAGMNAQMSGWYE